jgi:hypothetical protein
LLPVITKDKESSFLYESLIGKEKNLQCVDQWIRDCSEFSLEQNTWLLNLGRTEPGEHTTEVLSMTLWGGLEAIVDPSDDFAIKRIGEQFLSVARCCLPEKKLDSPCWKAIKRLGDASNQSLEYFRRFTDIRKDTERRAKEPIWV